MKALFAIAMAILLGFVFYMYNSTKAHGFQEQVFKHMLKECGPSGSMMVLFALDASDIAVGGCYEGSGVMQFSKGSRGDLKVVKRGVR